MNYYDSLGADQTIEEDALAKRFAKRFHLDPERGYGNMARKILQRIYDGAPWEPVSSTAFGHGSFGNGAAMRVGPLGAYFSEDRAVVVEMATRSARVTHYHPAGIAGAITIALATAAATSQRKHSTDQAREAIWEAVLAHTPNGEVLRRLQAAREMTDASPQEAARALGNGSEIAAHDTVPFCVWSACRSLHDYREAILDTIGEGGDCDTNCAIVGGIVSSYLGAQGIPTDWLRVRERLIFTL